MRDKPNNLFFHRGSILITSLWFIFMLTIFAVHLGLLVRQKLTLMDRLDSRRQLYLMAEAGIQSALAELRKEDKTASADAINDLWSNNEVAFRDISVGSGSYLVGYPYMADGARMTRYGMMDESGKINLNTADAETITRLLQLIGALDSDEATRLAYAIIDWRDKDSFFQHPQYGAEDDDYKDLKNPYECKDAPFEVLDELLLVKEMKQETFDKIKNFVTIYSEGSFNINTVSKEALLAFGLKEDMADRILTFRAGGDGTEGTIDDRVLYQPADIVPQLSQVFSLGANDVGDLTNFVNKYSPVTVSSAFMIKSTGRLKKNKQELEISAVVTRSGQIRYWREQYKKSDHGDEQTQF